MFYSPLTILFMVIFSAVVLFAFVPVQTNAIVLAFSKIGIQNELVFLTMALALMGSYINIPVKRIPRGVVVMERRISYFGFTYVIPVRRKAYTTLAVNLGGAVIPTLFSIYLLVYTGVYLKASVSTALMSVITFRMARPIRGIGIALPFFVPSLLAAFISIAIDTFYSPVIAYISGTLGTLIGADLVNLGKIRNLGAPVASIGGAGTFDGIFLNGITAVLLSSLFV